MNATTNILSNIDPSQLWYVSNRKLRTKAAIEQAKQIAEWIETREGLERRESLFPYFVLFSHFPSNRASVGGARDPARRVGIAYNSTGPI